MNRFVERTKASHCTFLVFVLSCAWCPCWGEEEGKEVEETVHELSPLEVVDRPIRETLFDETQVGAETVRREGLSKTVEGLLDDWAGVDLKRRSYAGNEGSRLAIRGFDESRLMVMLDGSPLHGAGVYGGYYVDWASLSLEGVEEVAVIRGMTPAQYGNTLGGVVDILSSEGSDQEKYLLRSSVGSLETWDVQAQASGGEGPVTYRLSAGHYETDGHLRNAFLDRDTVSAQLGFALPADIQLKTGVRYTQNESGMIVYNMPDAWDYDDSEPDSLGAQLGGPFLAFAQNQIGPLDWGDGSYWEDERLHLDFQVSRESERFTSSLQAYFMDQEREETFYAADRSNHVVLRRDSAPEENNWGWKTDFQNILGEDGSHQLEYGLSGHYLGYGGQNVTVSDPSYFSRPPMDSPDTHGPVTSLHGLYVQDTWHITEDVTLQAGVRMDGYKADGAEANAVTVEEYEVVPRLAGTVKLWQGGEATLRGGQSARFPTCPEYYWSYSGYQAPGGGKLSPERANQCEVELRQEFMEEKICLLARGYYYQVEDYIRTVFGYQPSRVVYNIDRVNLMGFELEGGYRICPLLKISANFTHQETEKEGDVLDRSSVLTDELVELPENKANLVVEWGKKDGLLAELGIGFVDESWAVRGDFWAPGYGGLAKMGSFVDVDARISIPLYKDAHERQFRLELAGENLLDEEIVEEYGYPLPGVTFMAGLRAEF